MGRKIKKVFMNKIVVSVFCGMIVIPAWSAEVSYSTDSYTAGDILTADDLNAKFNDIKAGIYDNHINNSSNRSDIEVNRVAVNDLSLRLGEDTAGKGVNSGDMQYWNGSAWVLVAAPSMGSESVLKYINGVPRWQPVVFAVGDRGPAGGIVFYITSDGRHGMEAVENDLPELAEWGCPPIGMVGAGGKDVGSGAQNTLVIVDACPEKVSAAKMAADYSQNGYSDWFLPSSDEIGYFALNIDSLSAFKNGPYWTSSEFDVENAIIQESTAPEDKGKALKDMKLAVRPVRAF
ncbi:MAG: hypothetical protein OEY36_04710 [Gammaproteobacteria bacterium]|nr:hypothetical protein [Gammaproteobacteria bacterium]